MWSEVTPATTLALGWLLLMLLMFPQWQKFTSWPKWEGVTVVLVALFVRLVPAVILPVGARYDIDSFRLVAEALLSGEEVYTSVAGRHPYLPLQMYWLGGALYLTRATAVPFAVSVKLLPILADGAITAVLYHAGQRSRRHSQTATTLALLYALNPIAILVSAYHGQFDAVPVFLLLLAWYYWHFGQRSRASSTALGLAILNKTWPVVLLPIMLIRFGDWRKWLSYTAVALSIPLLFTVAYLWLFEADPMPMLGRAFTHTGPNGYWGASALLAVASKYSDSFHSSYEFMIAIRRWLILAVGLLALWRTRRHSVVDALTTTILAIFAVSAGIGIQWLLWVVPFALLAGDNRWFKWYSLTGTLFILVQLYGLHMIPWAQRLFDPEFANNLIRLGSIPAWITVVAWAGVRLWQRHETGSRVSILMNTR